MTRKAALDLGVIACEAIDIPHHGEWTASTPAWRPPVAPVGSLSPALASGNSGMISPSANALLPFLPIPYVTSATAGWNSSLLATRPLRLAPRAGLAWGLPASGLKTIVRAGLGIHPNQAAYSIVTNLAQKFAVFCDQDSQFDSYSLALLHYRKRPHRECRWDGGSNLDHNFKIEYNEVWNINLERELSSSTVFSLAYIGSRTVHADSGTLLNIPLAGKGAIADRRPIPQLSQINDIRWNGWATYHALTAAKRRFTKGLMFDANWTWSHSLDDASDPGAATLNETNLPQNVYDLAVEKASSSFDKRQRVVVAFIYQFPLAGASGWPRMLVGTWQAGGNFTAQSGPPFTVNISSDQANIGAGPAQRPNVSGNPNDGPKTSQQWFNTSVFSLPAPYTFGNAGRNAVIGPGLQEFDLSLQREFKLTDAAKLQFRAEAYNLLNRPNFNIPNRIAFTANFGSISSSQDSRQLQFALKLLF